MFATPLTGWARHALQLCTRLHLVHAEARKSRSLAEKRAEEARRLMVVGKRERKPSAKVRHLHSGHHTVHSVAHGQVKEAQDSARTIPLISLLQWKTCNDAETG